MIFYYHDMLSISTVSLKSEFSVFNCCHNCVTNFICKQLLLIESQNTSCIQVQGFWTNTPLSERDCAHVARTQYETSHGLNTQKGKILTGNISRLQPGMK